MPYIPNVVGNSTFNAETLNAMGEQIGVGVTVVTDNVQTLWSYGAAVMAETSMMNRWYNLANKIVRSRLVDTMYKNRLAPTFKGVLDIGDGVEEILVPPAGVKRQNGNPNQPGDPYSAALPDIYLAWHVTNAGMSHSVNVNRKRLRQAFTSFSAMDGFGQYLVDSLYNGYEWDSQILTKFKAAQAALKRIAAGNVVAVESPITGDGTLFLASARENAELFKWMGSSFNDAGAPVAMNDGDLYMIMTAGVEAHVDVKDLAAAFNLDYANFLGRRMPIDRFTFTDAEKARILEITGLAEWPFTAEQDAALEGVLAILCDIDLFQIYDTHEPELWENPNGADASVDYWLHSDKIVSLSPFANYVVYVASGSSAENFEVQGG